MNKIKNKKEKGLSDAELIAKYESGKIDMKKPLKKLFKTPSNSAILKAENQP